MICRARLSVLALTLPLAAAVPVLGLANRVFVSQRSGNDSNSCDNILTPCQTFAGAVVQLNPDGEVIVLDSGGYGPVTITHGITIEAPAGVTAFIHPPSGDAILINAGATDVVTLRGLVLNGGTNNGITVGLVGALNVEHCSISGFGQGIAMESPGQLTVKETDVRACNVGIGITNTSGKVETSIDHCHLDENFYGYSSAPASPGTSRTSASNTTANGNFFYGWESGHASGGKDVLELEFCTGSGNGTDGLIVNSLNAQSVVRFSNCTLVNNANYGVEQMGSESAVSRGNNSVIGNVSGAFSGTVGSFSPM